MRILFFHLLIGLLLASCESSYKNSSLASLVVTSNIKRITLSAESKMYSYNMMYHFDKTRNIDYISIMDITRPHIDFYRLDSCSLDHTLNIDVQKNNIPSLLSHCVSDKGSVIVTTDIPPCVCILDENGDVQKRIELQFIDGVDETYLNVNFGMSDNIPLVLKDNIMFCPIQYSTYRLMHREIDDIPLALLVDTATGNITRSKVNFPDLKFDPKKTGVTINTHSRVFDGVRFVYSFGALSDIFVTTDFQSFDVYRAPSKYLGDIDNENFNPEDINENKYANYYYTREEFGNIVYDENNDVYYRFCYQHSPESSEINLDNATEYVLSKGDFSIQIIDKEFNVIGEQLFDAGIYAPKLFFVNKEGLWLSENNIFREDRDDSVLIFRCLKLNMHSSSEAK